MTGGVITRQCVGGPADGQWVDVEPHTSVYLVPGRPKAVRLTGNGFTMSDVADRETVQYQTAVAPTGERVFLVDGVTDWPERFDTEAWVYRIFPQLTGSPVERVEPWMWRGPIREEITDRDGFTRLRRWQDWMYVTISPDLRYRLRRIISGQIMRNASHGGLWQAEDMVAGELRRSMAYAQLPVCPFFDCDEKAIATVVPTAGSALVLGVHLRYRQRFTVCKTHAFTLMSLDPALTRGPDVIDRHGHPTPPDDEGSSHAARAIYSYGVINPGSGGPFRGINIA